MATAKKRLILQKKTALEEQLNELQKLFENGEFDNNDLKVRLNRLTKLFDAYEDLKDQLAVMEPDHAAVKTFNNLFNSFCLITKKIEDKISNVVQETSARVNHVRTENNPNSRRLKLPVANIPNFDGKYEKWFSFKNTFLTMVDAHDDLSDLEKFIYLQSSVSGDALNKISIYQPSAESYKLAWDALTRAYEKEHMIITRHLTSIIQMQQINKATHDNLIKFSDEMQQHVTILESLNVRIGNEMLVQLVYDKIPRFLVEKAQEHFGNDRFPNAAALFQFISDFAFRISERNRAGPSDKKRERENTNNYSNNHPNKARKDESGARAFILNTQKNCVICETAQHPLYYCKEFLNLSVPKRWDIVKSNYCCINCLRSHKDQCKAGSCKVCNEKHHSLLHGGSDASTSSSCGAKIEIGGTKFTPQ